MASDKKRPLVGVGVAVLRGKKVLLGRRRGSHGAGDWSFPGGHLEFGESVAECARRELAEETGLTVISMREGPWTNDIFEGDKHYITIFVFVDESDGDPKLLEPNKCEGWQWFDCNDLPEPLFGSINSLLKKATLHPNDELPFSLQEPSEENM